MAGIELWAYTIVIEPVFAPTQERGNEKKQPELRFKILPIYLDITRVSRLALQYFLPHSALIMH